MAASLEVSRLMLTGSTLLRVLLTVVVAALLAALWQALPPLSRGASTPAGPPVRRAEPTRSPPEVPAPGPSAAAPPAPAPAPRPAAPAPAAPAPAAPAPAAPTPSSPPQSAVPTGPPPVLTDPPLVSPPALPPSAGEGANGLRAGTPAAADTRPVAVDLVDLNSASVQALNRLRGGGLIGRAVVRGRPYAAVSDLLTKRVISRSVYERIRDQVTVH
jgi:hypothetical protein